MGRLGCSQFNARVLPCPWPSSSLFVPQMCLEPKNDFEVDRGSNTMLKQEVSMVECLTSTSPGLMISTILECLFAGFEHHSPSLGEQVEKQIPMIPELPKSCIGRRTLVGHPGPPQASQSIR